MPRPRLCRRVCVAPGAIVNGKAIKIEGGVFKIAGVKSSRYFVCAHEWGIPRGTGRPRECPECQSRIIHRARNEA
jgi:hypothetical protein